MTATLKNYYVKNIISKCEKLISQKGAMLDR